MKFLKTGFIGRGVRHLLTLIPIVCLFGCAPLYKDSTVMSGAGNIQEGKIGSEYFFIEPGFHFEQGKQIAVVLPSVQLKDEPLSRGESQYYAHSLQEKLLKMLSELGVKAVDAKDSKGDSNLVLETSIVRLLIGDDPSRRSFGLMGALMYGPIVEIEGAFYEMKDNGRHKVFAFYERGSKSGGSFINNLNGQELALGAIDGIVNENLRNLMQKNTKFVTPGYSQYRIKEIGLARDVTVYNVLLKMGVNISGKGDTFNITDGQLQWFATFESEGLSQIMVNRHFRAVWYAPDGSVYQNQTFNVAQGNALVARNKLKLDPARGNLVGKWQVKVYEDDQPMDDRFFKVVGNNIENPRTKAMETALLAQQQ